MAELSVVDLLKYKKEVLLTGPTGKDIGKVWVRVLGDYNLQLCYRLGRIASAKKRADLRTPGTVDYQEEIESIPVLNTREECINIIVTARKNNFVAEAFSVVEKEEPVRMDEIADDPDAATLEDQEKLDAALKKQKDNYDKALEQYALDKISELEQTMAQKSNEELFDITKIEISNLLAIQEFQTEVVAQKIFRATFLDEKCTKRAFHTIEEYKDSVATIKNQLLIAYNQLEFPIDDIKN